MLFFGKLKNRSHHVCFCSWLYRWCSCCRLGSGRQRMIFHRVRASLICLAIFYLLIWWGMTKLAFWHWPRFLITGNRKSGRFIYHFTKSLDQAACAGAFGGLSDETISNRAGRTFKEKGWHSPWWVVVTKKMTDRWEPPDENGKSHIENSIEPIRQDEWGY